MVREVLLVRGGAPPGGLFIVSILGALWPWPGPEGGGLSRGGPLPFMVVGSQLGLRLAVPVLPAAALELPAMDPLVAG